jgi:hypothetical protein
LDYYVTAHVPVASYRTRLSLYFSGPSYLDLPKTDKADVTYKTTQLNVGDQGGEWEYHTNIPSDSYWSVMSRKRNFNTKSISGNFISFKVVNGRPDVTPWPDSVLDIYDPKRVWQTDKYVENDYNDYFQEEDELRGDEYLPWRRRVGLAIRMDTNGNDIIIPNGRGQVRSYKNISSRDKPALSIDSDFTFIVTQNGVDSSIGGFGQELIFAENVKYTEAEAALRRKFNQSESNFGGSKFFVGGSDDDLLAGGKDVDLLVGDRFNGFELYLNRSALSANIPGALGENKQRLLNYQPDDWNNNRLFGVGYSRGLGNSISVGWIRFLRPGSDIIHGNGGNDYIYGDSNTDDTTELYHFKAAMFDDDGEPRPSAYSPSGRSPWSSLRIGADFLDGGTGNDEIHAGYGSDAIIGGQGSDLIYLGDQIIAGGYAPLWGPKIAWGSSYKDLTDESPDLFVLGDILTQEAQINAGAVEDTAKRTQEEAVAKEWGSAVTDVIESGLDIVTDGLFGLAKSLFGLFRVDDSRADAVTESPTDLDGCTVIRDFGKKDLLAIKIRGDESIEASRLTKDISATKNKYGFNPLVGKGVKARDSIKFSVQPKAGESFNRLILEGYTGSLYEVARISDAEDMAKYGITPADGDIYLLLGGDRYAGAGNLYIA